MENEKYRKFLEKQAEQNPVNIDGSPSSKTFKISWDNIREEPPRSGSSDILDSLYLGKAMEENVTVERRVAALIRDRLRGLEEENLRIRKRLTTYKIAMAALGIGLAFVLVILINLLTSQLRIIL